ncbi:unnamed protein product [Pleuronectes platessa]|uniref:G-protein coupled receptors family 1 profile domain-containing protein n=1 Tax=Pleuronectes platessa TaxID=8262 RepID=A0A9N7TZL0_PLEPL|nr:unnamed protein product [Pleuronectes platessa]
MSLSTEHLVLLGTPVYILYIPFSLVNWAEPDKVDMCYKDCPPKQSLSNEVRPEWQLTLHKAAVMNDTTDVNQLKPLKAVLSMLPCLFFLYLNGVMLFALLRKPVLLESSRYILFAHLLLTDSLQLVLTMLLYIVAATMFKMINFVCVIITTIATTATKTSPLNLALMSLESRIKGLLNINRNVAINVQYGLFLGLIIFPNCLSPLIYGLRDHTFRHIFIYYFTFGLKSNYLTGGV